MPVGVRSGGQRSHPIRMVGGRSSVLPVAMAVALTLAVFASPVTAQDTARDTAPAAQSDDLFLAPAEDAAAPIGGPSGSAGAQTGTATADARPSRDTLLEARGLVEADREALIAAEIGGRIVEMPYREGDAFTAGDTLVQLDCALLEAERDRARASLRGAQVTLSTNRQLQALGSVGQLDLAISEAEAIEAAAALEAAEVQVSKCTIPAPFDGRVVETAVNRFESVNPGEDLIAILDDGALSVRLIVPSDWLAWLAPETPFNFTVDETGTVLAGSVRALGARIDPASQTVPVFADLLETGERLTAGMSGTAVFWDAPETAR